MKREEWTLLDVTIRFVAGHGAIGGKTVYRPSDENARQNVAHLGIYVKAGLEKEKAAVLVAVAGLRDGRKVVVAVEAGHRESRSSRFSSYRSSWGRLLSSLAPSRWAGKSVSGSRLS
jgi:hypothetical protein